MPKSKQSSDMLYLKRALTLGAAVCFGVTALGGLGAQAQQLTKEQVEELKKRQQQQRQAPPQVQRQQGQGAGQGSGQGNANIQRERPSRQIQQQQPPQPRVVTPPPQQKTITQPPPPKVVTPPPPPAPKVVTPPPPPTPKVVTPPPPATPKVVNPSLPPQGGTQQGNNPQGGSGQIPAQKTVLPPQGTRTFGQPPTSGQAGGQGATQQPSILRPTNRPIGVSPTTGQVLKPGTPNVGVKVAPPTPQTNITQLQSNRVVTTDPRGRRIVQEPGNRIIINTGPTRIIHRSEADHIRNIYPGARSTPLPNGVIQTSYIRPDGVRVFTETDRAGRIIRRFGRGPGGRDIVYIDNRRFYRNLAIGAGIAAIGVGVALALAPPAVALPRERYIIDYDRVSDDELYEALSAPPIERLERPYSLEEIRYNETLRARMRRVDVDSVTFDTGSFTIGEEQYAKLERIARAMARVIERDPAETFLIEGHTDAVGNDEDNLSLSDRRAEAVAQILTEYYAIPLENLVTQGYGEQFLKIPTQEAERQNRRVTVRRISPLMTKAD